MVSREHQGEPAAHAEADDTGPAGAVVALGEPSAGRIQVAERLRPIAHEREEAGPPPTPVEQVRGQRQEALRCKPVGLAVQVMGLASGIVDDHHARPWSGALRQTEVGWHLTPRGSDAHVHYRVSMAIGSLGRRFSGQAIRCMVRCDRRSAGDRTRQRAPRDRLGRVIMAARSWNAAATNTLPL